MVRFHHQRGILSKRLLWSFSVPDIYYCWQFNIPLTKINWPIALLSETQLYTDRKVPDSISCSAAGFFSSESFLLSLFFFLQCLWSLCSAYVTPPYIAWMIFHLSILIYGSEFNSQLVDPILNECRDELIKSYLKRHN